MSLRDFLRINSGSKSGNDYSRTEFLRITDVRQTAVNDDTSVEESATRRVLRTVTPGAGKGTVILAPMKSLSFEPFTYPFQNTTKIRDALKLQVMPFTAAGNLEIFPVIMGKSGRNASGLVWYVSPDELDVPSAGSSVKIWPSPLPFVSQLEDDGGNGVTMWTDEENVCSILWQKNVPVLYRWKKLSGNDTEARELSWYDSYCKARGIERGGSFVVNASGGDVADDDFAEIVADSVKICPWIADVNLSRSILEGARDLERTVRIMTRVSVWFLVIGIVMLGAEFLSWYHNDAQVQETRLRSEKFYRETFDPERTGRISNPVNLARDRIASLSGRGDEGHPLNEVLADLGDVIASNKDITVDIIRYNQEGIDCTGTAPDMTTVLNYRRAWEDRANLVQVDNTQFVSGIGYRFDLRVRW